MTVRDRIRAVTDALPAGEWLALAELVKRIPEATRASICTTLTKMYRAEELRRRGNPPRCEYRSGSKAIVAKTLGRPVRSSAGFAELARLRDTDPKEYARLTRSDRGFRDER